MKHFKNTIFAYAAVILFLLNAALVSAEIKYTININLADSNDTDYIVPKSHVKQCETSCNFSIPTFEVPPGYTITGYSLEYVQQEGYEIYFQSTNDKSTQDANDLIMVDVAQVPEAPEITCNENKCDDECVVCKDKKCHDPGFQCTEKVEISRIFPSSASVGITQMNILIKNTGTVDVGEVYAEMSGDGITTNKKMPIQSLAVGDKDYTFTEINATKPGNIDLVIKLYVNGVLKQKAVGQLAVIGEEKPVEQANVTGMNIRIDELKDKYMALEQEYQDKSLAGYQLGTIYDQLKEARGYIANAQSNLLEGEYKKAEANLEIAKENIDLIETQLKNPKKKQKTFMDKFRENILYIGSTAAAIVSIFAAYTYIHKTFKKQKEFGREKIKMLRLKLDERRKAKAGKTSKGKKKSAKGGKKGTKGKKIKR